MKHICLFLDCQQLATVRRRIERSRNPMGANADLIFTRSPFDSAQGDVLCAHVCLFKERVLFLQIDSVCNKSNRPPIKASFFALVHPLICLSALMASYIDGNSHRYTITKGRREHVNPLTRPISCWDIRASNCVVEPTYKELSAHFRIYKQAIPRLILTPPLPAYTQAT